MMLAPSPNPSLLVRTPNVTPTSVPIEDRLPVFNTSEAIVRKAENRNVLVFSIPTRSSVLLKLASPKNHAYEERDHRWLHLLQAVAIVPSRKVDTIHKLVQQAIQLIPSLRYKRVLEQMLRGLLSILTNKGDALAFSTKSLIALRLKDQVSSFLRVWVVDPVEGYVLRKDHVVDGMRRDDLVATPVGAGYLRAYRKEDHMCVVVYPWGHGYIHVNKIEVVQEAIKHERLKRRHNQYLVLEHQHLFEQVESLLENLPEPSENTEGKSKQDNTEEYKQLLESLKEEHYDPSVLEHDLGLVERVQALATKLHKRQRATSGPTLDDEDDEEDGGKTYN